MKKYSHQISIVFLTIVLASGLRIAGTMGYYAMFTEDFVERFCENKERPELQCDGKCFLSKMLQESSNETQPINFDFLKTGTILFLTATSKYTLFENTDDPIVNRMYSNFYHFNFISGDIRPPQV